LKKRASLVLSEAFFYCIFSSFLSIRHIFSELTENRPFFLWTSTRKEKKKMIFPDQKIVEKLREEYPNGCRIELLKVNYPRLKS